MLILKLYNIYITRYNKIANYFIKVFYNNYFNIKNILKYFKVITRA